MESKIKEEEKEEILNVISFHMKNELTRRK